MKDQQDFKFGWNAVVKNSRKLLLKGEENAKE